MNFKKIAAAALAVASMGAAHADIGTVSSQDAVEGFVTIWNNKASLTIDLGIDLMQPLTAQTFDLAALAGSKWSDFATAAAGGSAIAWSFQGVDNDTVTLWTTAKVGQEAKAGTTTGGQRTNGQLDTEEANLTAWMGGLSTADLNVAKNSVTLATNTATADYWNKDGTFLSLGFSSTGNAYGATASIFSFVESDTSNLAAKYNFSKLSTTASLTSAGVFTLAATAAVPEPETYGLALVGLVLAGLVARRRA